MDPGVNLKYENPIQKAGWLSKVLFLWVWDLFRKGKQQSLQMTDLFKTLGSDNSKFLGDLLEKNWNQELVGSKKAGKKASLLKVVLKTFGLRYFLWGVVMFVQLSIRIIQPTVLAYFVILFERKTQDDVQMEMLLYGTLLVLMSLLIAVTLHQGHFYFRLIGMRCRVAISSLVYRKATRLTQSSLCKISTGDIINLLSNDVSRFDIGMPSLNIFWMIPFFAILIPYLLWREVGWSFLAGFCPLIIMGVPTQSYLANITRKLRLRIAKKTDHRVRLMTEILSGIQVIKMYTWEKPFEKIINEARDSELTDIKTCAYYRGIFQSCAINLDIVALFLTLMTYVLTKNIVTTDKVFAVTQYLNILQLILSFHVFRSFTYGAEILSALQRLGDFLSLEEKESRSLADDKDAGIYFENVCAAWTTSTPTLRDISLRISPGTLCAIVGQVGAGKSSLLQVILGELPVASGELSLGSEISFASQEPWLFGSSIRNNILFGQPYDNSWYDEIIRICSLGKDLQDLPYGDHTMVGDKGVTLSGGQKARINLARCVYRKASIYVMDDPLSAVDTQVGNFLFEECICTHLRGKTRILVTHQLQFLKNADLIVVMKEGRIEAQGTYQDLINSNLTLSKFVALPKGNDEEFAEKIIEEDSSTCSRKNSLKSISLNPVEEQIILRETEKSSSDPKVFALFEYFRSTKNACFLMTPITLLIVGEALTTIADYWAAFWTDQEEMRKWNNSYMGEQTINYTITSNYFFDGIPTEDGVVALLKTDIALMIYGIIILLAMVATFFKAMTFFKFAVMSSKNLHAAMFHSVLLAPMKFFTSNPCGRIMNRFSKDLGAVDELLPGMLLDAVQFTFPVFGSLVNITVTNPYTIGVIIICLILFWNLLKFALPAIKGIKHLEGVAKSPVFSHVSSTLNGLPTIRSTNSGSMLIEEFDQHQNTHTAACHLIHATVITLTSWVDYIFVFFLACITYSYIILNMYSAVNGSQVGLGITQILGLCGLVQFGFYQCSEVVNQLTNVERVLHYSNIETEGPFETQKENVPKETWPNKGGIEFKNLSLRYDEEAPPVLKDLNFTINPEEKVGIVGRTGAGKSSLISAFFRLAHLEGTVIIDGVDTKLLGLTYLRKRISIIPQDPVLFSGTLRCNLDPFDDFDDEEIWNVLAEVELSDSVTSLDFMVREGGSNFSLGQRQLICLARAMLRKNRILILDEATANVDLRVGIVGRTGAGKSSLISAFFRLAHLEGTVIIDGVDTKLLGLTYLRKRISIIPQDPVLFSGTLRCNLDPFDDFDDEEIWNVLAEVELSDSVTSLDFMVREGGSNFSLGQRQLICLARAMLRKNRILILDEATANVDLRADSIIHSSIRRNFKNCTVLTIAHRLNTIMDSDRVLVMSSGKSVEFDHPYRLLQNEHGYFSRMVARTGPALSQLLTHIAREAFCHGVPFCS